MNPTSRAGIPESGGIPEKKECIPCGSFVHCRLFTPNFRKFGIQSVQLTLPPGILLVSIPRIMSTCIPTLYGEEKKEEKEKENVF